MAMDQREKIALEAIKYKLSSQEVVVNYYLKMR